MAAADFLPESPRLRSLRNFSRTATADTEVRGRTTRKGDGLVFFCGSANREAVPLESSLMNGLVHMPVVLAP